MSEVTTTDATETVEQYLSMWNETDPDRRAEHIAPAWARECRYVDPVLEAEGRVALSEMVAGVHERFPGHRFERTSGVDTHHDQVRFGWKLVAPDGAVTVAGIDVGTIEPDGRLRSITGFFGDLPATE